MENYDKKGWFSKHDFGGEGKVGKAKVSLVGYSVFKPECYAI